MGSGDIGLDLIEIDRIERALERRPRLADRLFTSGELDYANSRARPARHLAARFAAKEAVIKAIGSSKVGPRQIEVSAGANGRPQIRLSGTARDLTDRAGLEVEISMTHSKDLAAAVAVLRDSAPAT